MHRFPKSLIGTVVCLFVFFEFAGICAPLGLAADEYGLDAVAAQKGKEQAIPTPYGFDVLRVVPDATSKFQWPYLLYFDGKALNRDKATILVVPNNAGTANDYMTTEAETLKNSFAVCGWLKALRADIVYLTPVFLRPFAGDSDLYTHALSRDALMTKMPKLERVDLQLIAMIEDAKAHLKAAHGITTRQKVGFFGFSAAGDFATRFAVLHPGKVKFSVAGGMGSLPIIPRKEWSGEKLCYPLGVSDLDVVAGRSFDLKGYLAVPQFIYQGARDTNDALSFRDSFSAEDEKLVLRLFPGDLNARWDQVLKAFEGICPLIEFHMYPNLEHMTFGNQQVADEIAGFMKKHL